MTEVTQESLTERIKKLESRGNAEYGIGLTLNEEFQLKAFKMLLPHAMKSDQQTSCSHDWWIEGGSEGRTSLCLKCGKRISNG
ncbi:hypothetical protein QOP16_003526 [Salmonella enterica]|nr:hypothetical protein [Salmonella enterica]ELU4420485.1 hypothetical protein [Salmonella enterica]